MKGLLLKDFYLTVKYCRAYLIIFAAFIVASIAGDSNFFFVFYPCLLAGMIPVTLIEYEERSKWSQYCGTLPYTKAQIVSGKYLTGLFAQLGVIALSAIAQAVRMNMNGLFDLKGYLTLIAMLLIASCFSSSISLPLIFKFGVSKGRIAHYIMIGVVCGGGLLATGLFESMADVKFAAVGMMPLLCAVMVAVYALSWYLSIVFYKKREV